jgi:hypothetical protein
MTPPLGKQDLLNQLRDLEIQLGQADLENFMLQQDEPTRKKFIESREQVSIEIGTLENAELAEIAGQLDQLAPELKAGLAQMQHELRAINNAIAIVNTVSTVLILAARVTSLV